MLCWDRSSQKDGHAPAAFSMRSTKYRLLSETFSTAAGPSLRMGATAKICARGLTTAAGSVERHANSVSQLLLQLPPAYLPILADKLYSYVFALRHHLQLSRPHLVLPVRGPALEIHGTSCAELPRARRRPCPPSCPSTHLCPAALDFGGILYTNTSLMLSCTYSSSSAIVQSVRQCREQKVHGAVQTSPQRCRSRNE